MKKTLKEELKRIHSLTYSKEILSEQSFLDNLLKSVGLDHETKKIDDPKKADFVTDNVADLFNTLQRASESGGLKQQAHGTMTYQKEVESMQIALILLGYKLPRFGVDGLFGPETANAVSNFITSNSLINEDTDDIRNTIHSLNYSEKGNEISSGGEVSDNITNIVDPILKDFKKTNPNVSIKITSGNDRFHKNLGYNSKHASGNAIDLTLSPYNTQTASAFKSLLDSYKSKNSNFNYIDEYTNPSGSATGGHFHLQYGSGGGTTGKSGSTNFKGVEATPAVINKLIELLKARGVRPEELKNLIDSSSAGGNLQGVSADDFSKMINLIINKLEGGYYHPDMNIAAMGKSGETMFGIDRKYGPESQTQAGMEFWKIIDDANAIHKWPNEYMGGEYAPKLRELVVKMMKPQYISFVKYYLTPEAQAIVASDPKLVFNFLYATYNGSGWFRKFADVVNRNVKQGVTDPNQLSQLLQSERKGSGNQIIARTGSKIDSILGGQV